MMFFDGSNQLNITYSDKWQVSKTRLENNSNNKSRLECNQEKNAGEMLVFQDMILPRR